MRLSLSHRFRLAGVAIAAGALTLTLGGPAVAQAAPATVVPDAGFAACLNKTLGVANPAAPLTQTQLQGLGSTTYVSCGNMGIKSIDGAQYLTNLPVLALDQNQISDISPLSGLTKLYSLSLMGDRVSDISPLSGLKNLGSLHLTGNQISVISALSGLTNLTTLDLSGNQISDITKLSGLTNLRWLNLTYDPVSNISPLSGLTNLTWLGLSDNKVSNVGPLSGLTNLTTLYVSDNPVSNISSLSGLTNLTLLYLSNNQISNVSALSGLVRLKSLYLDNNQISSVSPLSGLTNLTSLSLESNQISSVSPLSGLAYLTYLRLSGNRISDLSSIQNAAGLWPGSAGLSAKGQVMTAVTVTAGGTVSIPSVKAMPGYSPITWSVSPGSGTVSGTTFRPRSLGAMVLSWSDKSGYFTGSISVTVLPPGPAYCGFVDVPSTNEYSGYVCWMKSTGVTTGTTPTTFAPDANVTRGQMAAFMYRLAGSPKFTAPSTPSFTDVPASYEFFKQIEWLKQTGITTGTSPTTFAPSANVTRGQMAAFMYRLAGSPAFTPPVRPSFTDVPASSEFFKQIEWLKSTGITTGTTPTTYAPSANVTRAQMAAFMFRLALSGFYCKSYPAGVGC